MPCQSITCCPVDSFDFQANEATDADESDESGPTNPNCPNGYVWGGLACIRESDPQTCSTGYSWNGSACVAD